MSRIPDKPILVTGANGFLGSCIVANLLLEDLTTWGTDIDPSPAYSMRYKQADITSTEGLMEAIKGASKVIHAAGLAHVFSSKTSVSERFHRINAVGTANVAKAAAQAGVEHFVLISSVSVYGTFTDGEYNEETPCAPAGGYAESKYAGELRAADIARQTGMPLTILRLATLYGEGDPGNIKRLIGSIDRRRFIWVGQGTNRKSLLYKGDAARACSLVALAPVHGVRIYNVSAPPCTMRQIVDTIYDVLGKRPIPGRIPASVALGLSRILSLLPAKWTRGPLGTVGKWLAEDVYETRRFEDAFGFKALIGIEEGLRREVDWYQSTKH